MFFTLSFIDESMTDPCFLCQNQKQGQVYSIREGFLGAIAAIESRAFLQYLRVNKTDDMP
jgi:hypothetical protein